MAGSIYITREEKIIETYKTYKEEKLRLQERQKVCLEEMKEKFNVNSPSELQALIEKTEARREKLANKIEPMLEKLEEDLKLYGV